MMNRMDVAKIQSHLNYFYTSFHPSFLVLVLSFLHAGEREEHNRSGL